MYWSGTIKISEYWSQLSPFRSCVDTWTDVEMDEMGIMDMDELAIEHSHLEFQQEMKGAIDKADSHSKH